MPVTIVVADDHRMVRAGLRVLLNTTPGMQVVGEAGDGLTALRVVEDLKPAILVADVDMPPPTGIELARMLHSWQSCTLVVISTMYEERALAMEAKRVGAAAFVSKGAGPPELITAIRTVALGRSYWLGNRTNPLAEARKEHPPLEVLNDTDRELLRLIVRGETYARIEQALGQPREAVERSRQALMAKLGISSRAGLVSFAHEHGLL